MKMALFVASVFLIVFLAAARAAEINKGLALENVDVFPEEITADSNFTLTADIRNVADREFYGVRLNVQGGFPFSKTSPIYSIDVGTLRANEAYRISLNLSIVRNAESKEYPLQIIASYYASEPSITRTYYITHSETLASTLKVDKGVDLKIEKTEFPQKLIADVKDVLFYVYVKNEGSKIAREVKLTLAAQYPFVPSGKSFFIDKIESGETKQAVFHVDVDSSASAQTYPLDLFVGWKENDIAYSTTKTFGIPVEKGSNIPQFLNLWTIVFTVIAIAVFGVIKIWRLRKRKK